MSRPRTYKNCSVFNCMNTTINRQDLTFFKLPANEERKAEWLTLIQREDLLGKSNAFYRVCEAHFDTDSLLISPNRKVLKQNSVPKYLLPIKKNESKGSQATVNTASKYVQYVGVYKIDASAQTPNYMSISTPGEKKLQMKLLECQKKLKAATSETDYSIFLRLCDKFLDKDLADIVKQQIRLKMQCSGDGYSVAYKIFCFNLYYASPQAYDLLKDILSLPRESIIRTMYIPLTTRVNNHLMEILKSKAEKMTSMQRNCSLVVGVIRLKANLFYNIREDKIYGFHEIDGIQTLKPAKYALVAMINGIFESYKEPVGYALLGDHKIYESVTKWIDKLIEKLFEIGLNIRVLVSNTSSGFLSSLRKRAVSAERPYFHLNNRKIFYMFDAPHLIKLVRNIFMTHDFYFDDLLAKWDYIHQFYEKEKIKRFGIKNKLTEGHISPSKIERTKVKLAVQVLSASVAVGLTTYRDAGEFDPSVEGTIELITIMNNLFDFLNSSSALDCTEYQKAFCGEEYQTTFINKMLNFFASLKVINRENGKDVTAFIKFIKGFVITLKSLLLLFEDLRTEGYTCILTRQLNQECLENLLEWVRRRNAKSKTLTSWQLVSGLRKHLFTNINKCSKENNSNDEETVSQTVSQNPIIEDSKMKYEENLPCSSSQFRQQTITTMDYNTLVLPENNTLVYICGYLLKKCLDQHKDCNLMKWYVKFEEVPFFQDEKYSQYRYCCKDGGNELFIDPQDDFINFVQAMENEFTNFLRKKHIKRRLVKSLFEKIKDLSFNKPCSCFPEEYCKKLYLRLRLYFTLKYNGRLFRTCPNRRKYFTVKIF